MKNSSVLIIGKRGGILQWFEHLLDAAGFLPDTTIDGFALNHNSWQERIHKRFLKTTKQKPQIEIYTAKKLAEKINACRPDVILIADLFYLSDAVLKTLSDAKPACRIVHWIGDFFDERLVRSSEVIDHFYFTDSSFIADAKAIGLHNAEFLPLAVNPKLFFAAPSASPRKPDLLFIGAHSPNRQQFIDAIATPKTLIGKGWQHSTVAADHIFNKNIPIAQVAHLYRKHDLVLNVLNRKNVRYGLNMRCFEASACGAVLLTEDSPDNEHCFKEGEEILVYQRPEDIGELIQHLRESPEAISRIAQRGQKRTRQEHCYHHRILQILNRPY